MIAKWLSRKLGVVLATVGVALLPTLVDEITEAIDWRIFALAGGYIVVNVAQKVACAWIAARYAHARTSKE